MSHPFATMMLSAGEDVGWVQNMLGHSSLQMIFQRYYAWIPRHTRSDGLAFMKFVEGATSGESERGQRAEHEIEKSAQVCTKIVPLDEYRRKKGLRKIP